MPKIDVPPVKTIIEVEDEILGLGIQFRLRSDEFALLQKVVCEKAKEKLDACRTDNGTIMLNSFGSEIKALTNLAVHLSNPDVVEPRTAVVVAPGGKDE